MGIKQIFLLVALSAAVLTSSAWMYRNVSTLAPAQMKRAEAGAWLEQYADRSKSVLSGDIGSIAYHAPSMKFIDILGLTSPDILDLYLTKQPVGSIARKAGYIADTFTYQDSMFVYTNWNGWMFDVRPSSMPPSSILWGAPIGNDKAIAIAEIHL